MSLTLVEVEFKQLEVITKFGTKEVIKELIVQSSFKKFCHGEFAFNDKKCHSCPSSIDDGELKTIVEENPRTII